MLSLYRVICQGMQSGPGCAYVVANGTDEAYSLHKKYLDDHQLGYNKERNLKSVELIAELNCYYNSNLLLITDHYSAPKGIRHE